LLISQAATKDKKAARRTTSEKRVIVFLVKINGRRMVACKGLNSINRLGGKT
jgi:hypothetical protein